MFDSTEKMFCIFPVIRLCLDRFWPILKFYLASIWFYKGIFYLNPWITSTQGKQFGERCSKKSCSEKCPKFMRKNSLGACCKFTGLCLQIYLNWVPWQVFSCECYKNFWKSYSKENLLDDCFWYVTLRAFQSSMSEAERKAISSRLSFRLSESFFFFVFFFAFLLDILSSCDSPKNK